MRTILNLFLAVALLSVASLTQAANPLIGTWTLNLEKSKIPSDPPKSETRTYTENADGTIAVTVKVVTADGKELSESSSYRYDGKDYPVEGSDAVDSVSLKQISPHVVEYKLKKAGKVVSSTRRVLSKDGKTMTQTEKGTDSHGAKYVEVDVYDKG